MVENKNYSVQFANAMLAATPQPMLAFEEKATVTNPVTAGSIARAERELVAFQLQTSAVEDSYGSDVLQLTVITSRTKGPALATGGQVDRRRRRSAERYRSSQRHQAPAQAIPQAARALSLAGLWWRTRMVRAWKPHWPVANLFQCDMDGVSRHGGLVCAGALLERGKELGNERLRPHAEGTQCASSLTSDDVIVFRQEARQYRHVGIAYLSRVLFDPIRKRYRRVGPVPTRGSSLDDVSGAAYMRRRMRCLNRLLTDRLR